ncbi:DUF4184 family protein [Streptomyces sp. NPDC093109]|uniref:DUF4184 family protein n=1 Tax=Streptomyces sp. NPDC093109 TaxID=3154977 RepID=UPI00344E755D
MPFTLSHPAAVLPLLRPPFVPAALVAGAVAPDVPYFLGAVGVSSTTAGDWYEPFLNATETHSFTTGPLVVLPFALGLVAAYRLLRAPVTALLPSGLRLPAPERVSGVRAGAGAGVSGVRARARVSGVRARARYAMWLLISAVIGIASHLVWDYLTDVGGPTAGRLLQHASTAFGLAAIGVHLWRRRGRLRTRIHDDNDDAAVTRPSPLVRWSVVALLVAAPVAGAAVHARADFDANRHVTVVDYSRPTTIDLGNGGSETSYPETEALAPWGTVAEGVLTGAAKRAGAAFAVALLLYAAAWQLGTLVRRPKPKPKPQSKPEPEASKTPAARDT